jgi:hypothetical protein
MEQGMIKIAITDLATMLGYKGISIDKIDSDIFSNQLILKVSGDCDRYPDTIKPIPPFRAVTGL